MSDYRTEWTPQQVQDNRGEANEALPEARTTDRFQPSGTASGMDVRAGEDIHEQQAAVADNPESKYWLPSDPPRRPTNPGGE